MTFTNPTNPSNNDFQQTSGVFEFADRVRMTPGSPSHAENLGITYSASTLSVTSSDGTALSATNPGYILMHSATSPGQLLNMKITANQGFIDDTGASEIINNLFGLPTGVAYGQDLPFFIYAVLNDAEDAIAFMISRMTGSTISPVVGDIGAPDDAVANNQWSFFSFDNIDETLYDGNPCIMIGTFKMRMSASDDWTVQALSQNDGIGKYGISSIYSFPQGAFGGASGKHWKDNGGTAPGFTTDLVNFMVDDKGLVTVGVRCITNNVVGVGAVGAELALPYNGRPNTEVLSNNLCQLTWGDSGTGNKLVTGSVSPTNDEVGFFGIIGANANLNNVDFQANDSISGVFSYQMAVSA